MAGNVRGAMRPQGRSPPFLLIGLCVALCILGFNYWNLSYRNRDLSGQILDLQEQVRRTMSKRMTAERRGATVVDELKKCESTLDMVKNEIARKESEVISFSEQLKNKVTELTDCDNKIKELDEIRTNLKTCEENNVGINQELQKKKDELKAALQQATAQDAERCKICKGQWVEERKNLLNTIDKVLGPQALIHLREAGIDIGSYAQEIDAQQKLKVNPQNVAASNQVLPQGQLNTINNANSNVQVNSPQQHAQEQSIQIQPQQTGQEQNQLVQQQQPLQAQQVAQGQVPVVLGQGAQDVPQDGQPIQANPPNPQESQPIQANPPNPQEGQPIQANPPNPQEVNMAAGNGPEVNALAVDGAAAKSQNVVGNNNLSPGNADAHQLGADFVPVKNPGVDNVNAQVANDAAGQQANQIPQEKGPEPVVPNPGDQSLQNSDFNQNRVDVPLSNTNKTSRGNPLNKSYSSPLPNELQTTSKIIPRSSKNATQLPLTDTLMALHVPQPNNTVNNHTLDLKLDQGLPLAAKNQVEVEGMKYKQNAPDPLIPNESNPKKFVREDAVAAPIAKVRPQLFESYNNDFNDINLPQPAVEAADIFRNPNNFPQKDFPNQLKADNEHLSWRDHDSIQFGNIPQGNMPSLEVKAPNHFNDLQEHLGAAANSQGEAVPDHLGGIVKDEDSIDRMQHNMENDRMKNVR